MRPKLCLFAPDCRGTDRGSGGTVDAGNRVTGRTLERRPDLVQGGSHSPDHRSPGRRNLSHVASRTGDAIAAWPGVAASPVRPPPLVVHRDGQFGPSGSRMLSVPKHAIKSALVSRLDRVTWEWGHGPSSIPSKPLASI